ncbi:intraflagellar transport protein 25 homolog isoform 2-T9 [Callospermophilus lateralis]|uniref:intraflagellar transport protein 25 homolog isoform X3 n=1 Tax=Callospermophilus lateralis TaxID=76772 RepID=UPI004053BC85
MRQFDLCLSSEGSEVVLATSSDEKHPPENIIDGNPETFWTTTGMFPQEFIICFHKHVKVEKLIIQSYLAFCPLLVPPLTNSTQKPMGKSRRLVHRGQPFKAQDKTEKRKNGSRVAETR